MAARLWLEAAVVGIVTAIALALVRIAVPGAYGSVAATALTGLLVGAAFHLGFELAGLNRVYCKTGHACV